MKWIAIGLLLIVVTGVGIWVFLPGKSVLSPQDKTEALHVLLGRDSHADINDTQVSWATRKNQYLQFVYPSDAKIYTEDNTRAMKMTTILDSFSFSSLEDHVTAVVQVIQFTGLLAEYPAVNLRLSQSQMYMATSSGNQTVQFIKKDDSIEKSIFFKKNTIIISIAVTGYSMQKVDNMYSRVVSSLKMF